MLLFKFFNERHILLCIILIPSHITNCNLDAELSTGKIEDTAILKKITGQQSVRVEQKNQKAFDTSLYAKLWLSANKLPYSSDQTGAYYRRHVVIATPNTFDVKADPTQRIKKMDINLLSKLTTDEEKSGIFNFLMKSLRNVLKNDGIYVSARTIEERRTKYLLASDPITAFLDTAIKFVIDSDEPKITSKEVMYMAYSEFCSRNRIAAVKKEVFGKSLKKRFEWTDDLVREGDNVYRAWINRRLTPEYEKIANDALKKIGQKAQKYGQKTLDSDVNVHW